MSIDTFAIARLVLNKNKNQKTIFKKSICQFITGSIHFISKLVFKFYNQFSHRKILEMVTISELLYCKWKRESQREKQWTGCSSLLSAIPQLSDWTNFLISMSLSYLLSILGKYFSYLRSIESKALWKAKISQKYLFIALAPLKDEDTWIIHTPFPQTSNLVQKTITIQYALL
jgi:hypothetical protein